MERILLQLENMGENIDLQHVDMMIESKLPRWALLELYEAKIHDKPWSVMKLRFHLEEIVRKRESVNRILGESTLGRSKSSTRQMEDRSELKNTS
ncbi:unnamed protein product, partial [Gongylonema pulchrum]|uniref:Uncharacterized protein n=1 Tax=Gongylonema pulchrum TaxID=637853 RepID=A0A183DML5_9BILA